MPLTIDRGDRVFVVEVLFAVLVQQDGEAVIGLDMGPDALSVDQEQREELVLPYGLVEEFLLNIRLAGRRFHEGRIRGTGSPLRLGHNKDGLGCGEIGHLLFQYRDDPAVLFKVDLVAANVADGPFMFGFIHLTDMELDAACLGLREELRFDGLP